MTVILAFLKRYSICLQIGLVLVATIFLSLDITRPLANYDEATYAKVVADTLRSGDISTFTLSGRDWFEKPPLYLWLAMGSVKILGEHEFAFRVPGIIMTLLCLWLVFLIVRELTGNELAASVAFFTLLFTPFFYLYGREVRLDTGVIMTILAGLFFWLKGRRNEKFLFWILPLAAVGFLFKSVIVFLLGPVLLIYSLLHHEWTWLKSKYLWLGFLASLIVITPWHLLESLRFGWIFWNDYLGHQVFDRAVSTVTGNNQYYDYVGYLWMYNKGWFCALIATILVFPISLLIQEARPKILWRTLAASLLAVLLIFILFSVVRTHLSPYILPIFPFIAIFIGLLFHGASTILNRRWYLSFVIVLPLMICGVYYCFSATFDPVLYDVPDEVAIGRTYKTNTMSRPAPLYALGWRVLETVNYYGDVKTVTLNPAEMSGKELQGPFYMFAKTPGWTHYFFYHDTGAVREEYKDLQFVYLGKYLTLVYSDHTVRLPQFNFQ